MLKRLLRTKTFWAAVAALAAAAERVATGRATLTEGLQIALPALLALFIRDGIAKAAEKGDEPSGDTKTDTPAHQEPQTGAAGG